MPKIKFISFYVKNKLTYLIAILLLFITFKYSIAYKSSYIELVNIFIYLFFTALFPTIFLTNLISCSISFDKIKNKFILKVITISLCLIGGSLTTINIAKKIKFKCLKDKELFLINLSGGSLSYYFLVFSFYNQFKPWLLTTIIFLAKLIISLIILNDFSFIPSINNRNYIFESLNTSFNSLYNMLKSLTLITNKNNERIFPICANLKPALVNSINPNITFDKYWFDINLKKGIIKVINVKLLSML